MTSSSIFYHYTSQESLTGILSTKRIFTCRPHPATQAWLGASNNEAVFLTRMDPNNSKEAIAFNNYRSYQEKFDKLDNISV